MFSVEIRFSHLQHPTEKLAEGGAAVSERVDHPCLALNGELHHCQHRRGGAASPALVLVSPVLVTPVLVHLFQVVRWRRRLLL